MAIKFLAARAQAAYQAFISALGQLRREQMAEYERSVRLSDEARMREVRRRIEERRKS